ncbi:hypothetical protein LY76DRAFT_589236 [Colletotrichum caudatum]|nr:hypothetical protein LY76DRAFT_589236 [Colletotrichum caudatum]
MSVRSAPTSASKCSTYLRYPSTVVGAVLRLRSCLSTPKPARDTVSLLACLHGSVAHFTDSH